MVLQNTLSWARWRQAALIPCQQQGRSGPLERVQVKVAGLRPSLTLRGTPTSGGSNSGGGVGRECPGPAPLPPALEMNPEEFGGAKQCPDHSSCCCGAPQGFDLQQLGARCCYLRGCPQ